MKVFHGSQYQVKHPNVERGRQSTDFGKGFYVTTNIEQAKRWALNKQRNAGDEAKAIVSVFEIDDAVLSSSKYRILKFDSPNAEWLSFVVACRKNVLHDYEMVFGPVANDRIYATITLFESNVLNAEETIARLKVDEFFNQVSFHTNEALNELTFIESIEITTNSL